MDERSLHRLIRLGIFMMIGAALFLPAVNGPGSEEEAWEIIAWAVLGSLLGVCVELFVRFCQRFRMRFF